MLSGVLHAAGVGDKGLLNEVALQRVQWMYASKAMGAWYAQCAAASAPLEVRVLFSSVGSGLGNVGQANYAAIMPPHSFINAGNFPEPKDLAYYLKKLSGNKTEYLSYFWWKDFYEIRNSGADLSQSFCELCQSLHQDQTTKVYSDLTKWWVTQSRCKKLHLS